jgi:hypothetical protein
MGSGVQTHLFAGESLSDLWILSVRSADLFQENKHTNFEHNIS